uniref:DUF223 domain-containing protein n=1 Tax=Brassica oleracea var. oleracea TaxID=109376 RepID=A0A0D3AUW2_BRAOL
MRHYDKLSEVSYNPKITVWRFRVKIHRIYPFYSYVTSSGPFYTYVLADEEVRVKSSSLDFLITCLEKQEGKWVEIFRVEVKRSYSGFNGAIGFTLNTQVHIIDPLNNRHFMDFKNIHAIPHMDHRDRNYPIDTMGVVFNTEAHFDDPASARMEFYIRDNIDSQIKCVATGAHAYAFRDGLENMKVRRQVIVVLKMWRVWKFWSYFGPPDLWLEIEGRLSDFRFNPHLPEVEEFRQFLLHSDPYVQRYGAV